MATDVLSIRPRTVTVTAVVASVITLIIAIGGWFAFPADIRAQFEPQQLATLVIFLVFIVGFMGALASCTLWADASGVRVRNAWSVKHFTWEEVAAIRYRPGDPWAFIFTGSDSRRHQVLAIQSADGKRAERAAAQLLEMARRYGH